MPEAHKIVWRLAGGLTAPIQRVKILIETMKCLKIAWVCASHWTFGVVVDKSLDDMRFYEAQAPDKTCVRVYKYEFANWYYFHVSVANEWTQFRPSKNTDKWELCILTPACGHDFIFPSDFDRLLAGGRSDGLVLIYCVVFLFIACLFVLYNGQAITIDSACWEWISILFICLDIDFGIRWNYHLRKVAVEWNNINAERFCYANEFLWIKYSVRFAGRLLLSLFVGKVLSDIAWV